MGWQFGAGRINHGHLPANLEAAAAETSTVGSKIEAEFVGVENGVAKLKKRDGSERRVPLDKLSEADQQWIRSARP